jgi:hypothetical protein
MQHFFLPNNSYYKPLKFPVREGKWMRKKERKKMVRSPIWKSRIIVKYVRLCLIYGKIAFAVSSIDPLLRLILNHIFYATIGEEKSKIITVFSPINQLLKC